MSTARPAGAILLDEQAEPMALSATSATRPNEPNDGLTKIGAAVHAAVGNGQPRLGDVARAVHMSARTLQRRLGDASTTFQELVDRERADLARAYIANRARALGDVAYLLGFSEISAFARAFKRWTGMTPRQWRDRSTDLA